MPRSTVSTSHGTPRNITQANLTQGNRRQLPKIIASSAEGIVFATNPYGNQQFNPNEDDSIIFQRDGIRSGSWSTTSPSPIVDNWATGAVYDAPMFGARPDRIRIAWQPDRDVTVTFPGVPQFSIPPRFAANWMAASWTPRSGPLDITSGGVSNSGIDAQGQATRAVRALYEGLLLANESLLADGDLLTPGSIHSEITSTNFRSTRKVSFLISTTGAIVSNIETLRAWSIDDSEPITPTPGFQQYGGAQGGILVSSPTELVSISDWGRAEAHEDGFYAGNVVAGGNSTTARTIWGAHSTTSGIAIRSAEPAATTATEHPTIPFPPGRSLENLSVIHCIWMAKQVLGVIAVWATTSNIIAYGHEFHPAANQADPVGWHLIANDNLGIFTPELWVDKYPADNTFRFAGQTSNATYIWEELINDPPDQPRITTPSGPVSVSAPITIAWEFSDPDFLDTQSAYQIRQIVDGRSPQYWTGTINNWSSTAGANTKIAGITGTATVNGTVPTGQIGEVIDLSVRVWDQADVISPWSNPIRITRAGIPLVPTIINPTQGVTITSYPMLISWTPRGGQGSYRIRIHDGPTTAAEVIEDTGRVLSTASSAVVIPPKATGTQTATLTLWTIDNVESTNPGQITYTVNLPLPGTVRIRAAGSYASNEPNIALNYYSTSPGTLDLAGVDIYRRIAGETDRGIRVAANLPIPETWATGLDWTDHTAQHLTNYEYEAELRTLYTGRRGGWARINDLVEN